MILLIKPGVPGSLGLVTDGPQGCPEGHGPIERPQPRWAPVLPRWHTLIRDERPPAPEGREIGNQPLECGRGVA